MEACYHGQREMVTFLLQDLRINMNKTDDSGSTGFMSTYQKGYRFLSLLASIPESCDNNADNTGRTRFRCT